MPPPYSEDLGGQTLPGADSGADLERAERMLLNVSVVIMSWLFMGRGPAARSQLEPAGL
jgi:hypothetical protein